MKIHILSDRRLPFSSSPLAAVPLLPRSGFVQCARRTPYPGRRNVMAVRRRRKRRLDFLGGRLGAESQFEAERSGGEPAEPTRS
jgi:hypothetical protein